MTFTTRDYDDKTGKVIIEQRFATLERDLEVYPSKPTYVAMHLRDIIYRWQEEDFRRLKKRAGRNERIQKDLSPIGHAILKKTFIIPVPYMTVIQDSVFGTPQLLISPNRNEWIPANYPHIERGNLSGCVAKGMIELSIENPPLNLSYTTTYMHTSPPFRMWSIPNEPPAEDTIEISKWYPHVIDTDNITRTVHGYNMLVWFETMESRSIETILDILQTNMKSDI